MLLASKLKMVLLAAAGFAAPARDDGRLPVRESRHRGSRRSSRRWSNCSRARCAIATPAISPAPASRPRRRSATIRIARPLAIMKHQVSSADYQRCVADGACRALPRRCRDRGRPAGRAGELARCRRLCGLAVAHAPARPIGCRPTRNGPTRRAAAIRTTACRSTQRSRTPLARALRARGEPEERASRQRAAPVRHLRGERERPARCRRQCLGMDQHLLRAHRARCSREATRASTVELRRARGRGPAPRLRDGLHPRCARRRMRGRRAAEQSRVPAGARAEIVDAAGGLQVHWRSANPGRIRRNMAPLTRC